MGGTQDTNRYDPELGAVPLGAYVRVGQYVNSRQSESRVITSKNVFNERLFIV